MPLLFAFAFAETPSPPKPARELRAALEEVRQNVEGIKTAVVAYHAQQATWYACGTADEAKLRGAHFDRTPWEATPCWKVLAFDDPGLLRGGYWVAVDGETVSIHGVIDADGDGVYAEYVATKDTPAATTTAPTVY